MEKNRISLAQLAILLFLSRIFHALTYYPGMGNPVSGLAMLYSNIIGTGILLLLFLPVMLMANRYPERSVVMNLRAGFHGFGSFCGLFYYVFLVLLGASTLSHFQFFMTNAVFTGASTLVIVIPMMIVAVYAAHIGIEGISRSAFLIFIGFCIAFLFIIFSSIPNVRTNNLISNESGFAKQVMTGTYSVVSRCAELIMFYLLLPYVGHKTGKAILGFNLLTLSVQETMAFFILTVLGSFANSQTFPFYSLASMSEISIFQRMDALYMGTWVLTAFIRLSLLLFLGTDILKFVLPQRKTGKRHQLSLTVTAVLIFAAALPACYNMETLNFLYTVLYTGGPLIVLGIVVPVLLLIKLEFTKKKKERE